MDLRISIHALLAESDSMVYTSLSSGRISIHALLAESDPTSLYHVFHPAHFYPRSPCGERPLKLCKFEVIVVISIHALLAESDLQTSD